MNCPMNKIVSMLRYANMRDFAVILVVTLVTLIPYTEACSCQMTHPQDSFCRADFVVKAKIKHMKQIFSKRLTDDEEITIREPYENRYSIRIKEFFKGHEALRNISQLHAFTPAHDGMCGTTLEIGETYVMTGRISNDKMTINLCDFIKTWDSLPKWQRRGMTDRYAKNCDCHTEVCYNDNCYHKNVVEGRENICILELHRDREMCHINHSFCKRDNGECSWSHPSQWRECRRNAKKKEFEEP